MLDLDRLQPGQLAQTDIQDVFGLALGQRKPGDQRLFGLICPADDGDHLVDIEQDKLAPLQDVGAVQHPLQAVSGAALDRLLAELSPLHQHLAQ